jgi:hypothetical protein
VRDLGPVGGGTEEVACLAESLGASDGRSEDLGVPSDVERVDEDLGVLVGLEVGSDSVSSLASEVTVRHLDRGRC